MKKVGRANLHTHPQKPLFTMASMMLPATVLPAASKVSTAPRALPLLPAVRSQIVKAFPDHPQLEQRASRRLRARRELVAVRAAAQGEADVKASEQQEPAADWIAVCLPEELPKGVRKEVEVDGKQVLLFWYRNQIYCTEARSPAEGAYSEGFIKAKFTQDYCIECPSTGSLFSLKDGSIVSWYPNNPVLRALTPQDTCRPLEIFPVKLTQEAIFVDVTGAKFARAADARGGSRTSAENNNVFSVQPTVYFEGMDPAQESASIYMEEIKGAGASGATSPAVAIATTAGVGAVAVAGTAVCIYLENLVLLGVFWAILGGAAAYAAYQYVNRQGASMK